MIIIAVFVVLVFLYSLASHRLERTILTAPIVFTVAGILLIVVLPVMGEFEADRKAFLLIAEVGLVLTLFVDATRINLQVLKSNENLPVRLLGYGMLPTIVLGALGAAIVFPRLSLWEAGILAAILAPTDAGLGEVIVNSPRVPMRIRQALSVEAGLNDGLSVPFLMLFIALAQLGTKGAGAVLMRFVVEQLGFGALVGVVIGLGGGWLLGLAKRQGWMAKSLQQLGLVALPLLCVMGSEPIGGSMFIAGYVAGIAVQVGFREAGEESIEFTEGWGRLLDFFVFFLFGMLVALAWRRFSIACFVYAALSLTVVRMLPVAVALIGTRLSAATLVFMGWFGPRGLASIVLGLVYLEQESHLPGEPTISLAVMVTVALSIFAHGFSTLPGIGLYARKIATLDADAPEYLEVVDVQPLS
ncbi:MAG TPA: sodium:proton exchanger [Syntrophobacteraceae bacterium]|nr:sodium:proton exchanger [Syntrophobacteraceae bacterium]